jgi:putative membrane protein insertion efficiency factor
MSASGLNPAQRILLALIRYYQGVWSPDHSPRKVLYPYGYCRFSPTCSQYGYQAIEKYGAIRGTLMALWRISRCNSCFRGGHDPVP